MNLGLAILIRELGTRRVVIEEWQDRIDVMEQGYAAVPRMSGEISYDKERQKIDVEGPELKSAMVAVATFRRQAVDIEEAIAILEGRCGDSREGR